ncbi:hypothetical protein N781_01090 [Pontibacillus halophilus JSM 076056 = DSM 19796]|uniref:Uncharacterized protein n=1 Tax=Pontibacillus halophilus JSM 076056 = DSM 19796 TaxID=1385510 RepID=A0A0A5GLC2_9BACI|nr:hypothetical protein [Pontibacillus halophilus]KGX94066.1 hypothetical protein N781_01090 [Pontibacillus halophilus JSM 076056 = DSM 19796]
MPESFRSSKQHQLIYGYTVRVLGFIQHQKPTVRHLSVLTGFSEESILEASEFCPNQDLKHNQQRQSIEL